MPVPYSLTDNGDKKVPTWILEDRANCMHLFHDGIGNNDPAIRETLWAAYNGITEYVDHWRARGERQHFHTVCLGRGFQIKSRAYDEALKITGTVSKN